MKEIFANFDYRISGSVAAAETETGDKEATNLWNDATNRRQSRSQEVQEHPPTIGMLYILIFANDLISFLE